MAPKRAMKRKGAHGGVGVKRVRVAEPIIVDPVVEKTEAITAAIQKFSKEEDEITDLVLAATKFAFEKPKEQRDPKYFDPLIEMVEETLSSFVNRCKERVENAKHTVENSDHVKEAKQVEKDALEVSYAQNEVQVANRMTQVKELEMDVNRLAEEYRDRVAEADEAVAAATRMERDVVATEKVYEKYKLLRDNFEGTSSKDRKKIVLSLQKFLEQNGGCSSIVSSVAVVLTTNSRGDFDNTCLNAVNKVFDDRLERLRDGIAKEKAQAEPQTKNQEIAKEALSNAEKKFADEDAVLKRLEADSEKMKDQIDTIRDEIENHDSNIEELKDSLDGDEEELVSLKEVYAGFLFLRDRTDIVAEQPDAEQEKIEEREQGGEEEEDEDDDKPLAQEREYVVREEARGSEDERDDHEHDVMEREGAEEMGDKNKPAAIMV